MTISKRTVGTVASVSAAGWRLIEQPVRAAAPSDTRARSNENALLVQGRIVNPPYGGTEFVVTVDPTLIDRKLAIRTLNDRLEGRTPRSNTFADVKAPR